MDPSIVRVSAGRRVVTALFVPIFLASLFASTLTAATPTSALGASPRAPTVVSPKLTEAFAKSRDGSVAAVVTAHDRRDLAAIRRLGIRGTELRVLPMLLVKDLDQPRLTALQRSGLVRSVWPNTRHKIQMEDSNWIIGSRYVWGPPHAPTRFGTGYTGKGVDVAVIDTGIDGEHSDTDNLVEFCDTTAAISADREEVVCFGGNDRSDSAEARAAAFDDEGHGSHVSGTVGGTGDASGGRANNHSTIGVAPDVDLHVYSANLGPFLANFQILAAYDDMTFKKLNENSGVVATSNSFGGGDGANYSPDDPQNIAIKAAYDANIISVYAAGNSGPEHNTLSDSCINPYVVCVGATTKPDSVVQFSSRGRPSEPADTNRNGIVGDDGSNDTETTSDDIEADVEPDNHDRRLGQKLGIGLYRPTLVAPGVNINSISAFLGEGAPGPCSEVTQTRTNCYEQLNGTSMATPHVSGAIGVIVQAYRRTHGGTTPNAARIIDILERSAALSKLPGYEAEEQGAGRLNVLDAVRYARGDIAPPKPNFGTPSPVYAEGKDPRTTFTNSRLAANIQKGCTGALSFTAGTSNPLDEPADQPPDATARFGQKLINVPPGAERLRITVRWPEHPGANLYVRLWRPDVNPNAEFSREFDERAFPDQEAIGLLNTEAILNQQRFLDVRAPEAGVWRVRIYHRIGGVPLACDVPDSSEALGYRYQLLTEIPVSARVPTVAITSPADGSTHTGRFVFFNGTAGYPERWDGVTNYEVPGTGIAAGGPAEDTRLLLHFQGNTEEGCSGDGTTDVDNPECNGGDGPSLLTKAELSESTAASYTVINPIIGGNTERNPFVPNWIWDIDAETTLRGAMTVQWWGSCSACGPTTGSADWIIRLYADGKQQFQERVTETPSGPDEATLLEHTFDLPAITAKDRFVLHIDPVYIDSQNNAKVYYDSKDPCPTNPLAQPSQAACDSTVLFPVVDPNDASPSQVENLRVTDIHTGLRIAWDPNGAGAYEVHRSTNPAFTPSATTRLATTAGTPCDSPSVPTWTSASDGGALCFTDTGTATLTTYYYRIVGNDAGVTADASLLAYGTETQYDRQVKVRADRLYGPGYFEYARLANADGTRWKYALDTLERDTPTDTFRVSARSFTQGIGSANASRTVDTIGEAPAEPRDPAVALTKTGPLTTTQGSTITYKLRYENFGPEAASTAKITDVLPSGVTFVSANGGGTYSSTSRKVTWQLGTVSVGETGSVTLKVRVGNAVPDGTTITNTAKFTAPLTVATPGFWFTLVE